MTTNQSWIKVFGVHSFGGPSQESFITNFNSDAPTVFLPVVAAATAFW